MAKTTKRTISKNKAAKTLSWYEQFKFMGSWNHHKVSDDFIEKLTETMMNYFEDRKNICVFKFLNDRGIIYESFRVWTKKYEDLGVAYRLVKERIGSRREELSIFKDHNANAGSLAFTLRKYNPHWKDCVDEDSALKLKQSEKGSNETKIVVIEKFKDDPEDEK